MSFDLYFHSRSQTQLQTRDLEEYFRSLSVFTPQEEEDRLNFHYNNEDTWVYCTFSIPRSDIGSCKDQSLDFRVNYNRPISFPCETFPLVESFCKQFDLLVEDVQEETIEEANAGRLIDSWRRHNVGAVKAVGAADIKLHYFPESKTFEWWRYTRVRKQIDEALSEDTVVPIVVFMQGPDERLFRMFVHPQGAVQLLPPSDRVLVVRSSSGDMNDKSESGFVDYDEFVDRIGQYLDDYKGFGETIKYLRPANALAVAPIVQDLRLDPVDVSIYKAFPANAFHNVEMNGVK